MDITNLLVQLLSGAVGGNVAGAAMKKSNLGTLGNSIAGIIGGGLGAQILSALGMAGIAAGDPAATAMSLEQIASNVAGGGVGGAVLIAIIGAIRKSMTAKSSS
jgi:uncharacterized membrane protein YeaQ/YmgE (transglycosylase-associated protein family)